MSTLDPTLHHVADDTGSTSGAVTSSIVAALTSSDHKVIGRLLVTASLLATLVTGVLGALLGAERISGDGDLLPDRIVPELFAGYRVGLVLGGVVPLLLGLAVFAVPLQLGARSLAFPRLAAAGFWTWLGGVVLLIISLFNNGGPEGGDADMVRLYIGALVLVTLGLIAVAVPVATSVLTTRAPGMKLHRVPPFAWASLIHALGVVLVLPILVGVLAYLYMDDRYATAETSLFGGGAGTNDWGAWLLTGPSLALFAVPAVGLLAEFLPVVFRKRLPMRGVLLAGISLVGVGILAGVTQQQKFRLPGTGGPVTGRNWLTRLGYLLNWAMLSLLPLLGIVVVLAVGALLAKPPSKAERRAGAAVTPKPIAPFVFALLGVGLVAIGILGAAASGIEDLGLDGTVFEEGATVALVYGAVLAGLGGIVYWFPKWTGAKVPDAPAYGLALLGALGAVLASVPYLIAGFADQPARAVVFDYEGPSALWNVAVTVGHAAFAVTVLAVLGLLLKPAGSAATAGDDPWDAQTLEWATTSPAPAGNFATTPAVRSPEPLTDLKITTTEVAP
ncbi:cbb3-type cytochrome c oxidase subunit I [Desertimonas flava]|uniref:cbb3-type cytochrome c oxidase subunit I n=1 Tax=Desertimonas flava TaxID=2064846 RepID=UPI000E35781F|nr:cbb3-type cytochrome c oxidase subunit I [Desertimonas flava]